MVKSMGLSKGSGKQAQDDAKAAEAANAAAAAAAQKKEEAPVKKAFDLYLKAYPAASKLTIIKEMKPIFGLGLKEVG